MIWQELTSRQLNAVDRAVPVLLPVAAIEQHGPHLPLATDRLIAEHYVARLHEAAAEEVLILPTVAVGCSEHHMEFPGSLTLSHDTFRAVAEEYLHSAWRHGFRRFLILNAHGGNQGVGQVILESFGAAHRDSQVVLATWWRIAAAELTPLNETGAGGVGHAGEFETSLMMEIAPHLVQTEAIPDLANAPTYEWAEADLLRSPLAALFRTMKQQTPTGAYGAPRAATAEKGRRITELVIAALLRIVRDLRRGASA